MDFEKYLNNDKFKDVIKLISNNKKLSDRLILNTIKENYDSEEYWKYVIEKVSLSNDFILENIAHINLEYILKFQKFDSDMFLNFKFINNIIERDYVNHLVRFQQPGIQTLEYLILNGYIEPEFWKIISQYQILPIDFIRKYDDKLDWNLITIFQNIDLELITDYLDRIDWSNIPLNISSYLLINNNTIKIFDKYPIWENSACLNNLSTDVLFEYFDRLTLNAIINILSYRDLDEKFINKIIEKYDDVSVWKSISSNQPLTEEYIDKYIDKLDWNELSENHNFSNEELSKYNKYIDYKKLSYNDNFDEDWIDILLSNKKTNDMVNNIDCQFLEKYGVISDNCISILKQKN